MSDLIWAAAIAAVPPTLVVLETYRRSRNRSDVIEKKVDVVHTLANDRLTTALDKIEVLTASDALANEQLAKALDKIEGLTETVNRLTDGRTRPQ